jgi:hypothetical protein
MDFHDGSGSLLIVARISAMEAHLWWQFLHIATVQDRHQPVKRPQ